MFSGLERVCLYIYNGNIKSKSRNRHEVDMP